MNIDKYRDLLENAIYVYHPKEAFVNFFGRIPATRYDTFKYCLNNLPNKANILELGTSRSFVDGKFEGCNSDDPKFWQVNRPEMWDWSAGFFSKVFTEKTTYHLTTVDLMASHIQRCKLMTHEQQDHITYVVSSSVDFLRKCNKHQFDMIYMDTGDMTPIEPTAVLSLEEAKIIVERNLLKPGGILLIDDVRSIVPKQAGEQSDYGKAKYSLPYLLKNGFTLVMDEYQVVLRC